MTLQAATWKDKITDSSNYWLGAIRLEEDGRLSEAAVLYLKDAAEALKQGLRARAALSCSCAASCLEKTGKMNAARNLYFEAAKIYEEAAELVFGSSIREALWLLQEAHDYYIIGGDAQKAGELYDECASLARKSSPFINGGMLDKVLRIRRDTKARSITFSVEAQTSEVNNAIEAFLRLRDAPAPKSKDQAETLAAVNNPRRSSIEKGFTS
jgi:tetratricopeptide (TPR) repeat protein